MSGDPINHLNQGLVALREELNKDLLAAMRVEVAIMTFNSSVNLVQDFVRINQFQPPYLSATGTTATGQAIKAAIDLIDSRKQDYANDAIPYYLPWILLITDGLPTDHWGTSAKLVHKLVAQKKVKFFTVGVGGVDLDILSQIAPPDTPPLMLQELRFTLLFQWVSSSGSNISRSSIGEQVTLPPIIWAQDL